MTNEQTNKTDTVGVEANTPLQDSDAEYLRLKEKNNKIQEELIRGQKLRTESLLAGEGGGRVEAQTLSEAEIKKKQAAEFFKGTELEKAILKDGKK